MENKLQQLTQKLYDEGLEKGRAEADKLVADAKAEARKIVAEARAEAEEIVKKAIVIQILWNGDLPRCARDRAETDKAECPGSGDAHA